MRAFVSCCAVALSAAGLARGGEPAEFNLMKVEPSGGGHPRVLFPVAGSDDVRGIADRGLQTFPNLSKMVTGNFVNFDSPALHPLTLSRDGERLFALNGPAGTLVVIATGAADGNLPRVTREIPVGIDPVTVRIQPGTADQVVWVVNSISDDISIVDVSAGATTATISVGDEPVELLFDESGRFAYIILQGPALDAPTANAVHGSDLVTIDVASRTPIHRLRLPCHTPRAAAIDLANAQIVVASLHSGNNTTTVGGPVTACFTPTNGIDSTQCFFIPGLQILRDFSVTASVFDQSPLLAPWPDISTEPGAPSVMRIVPDGLDSGEWAVLLSLLLLPSGELDPAVVAQLTLELSTPELQLNNAEQVLIEILSQAVDTLDNDLIVVSLRSPDAPAVSAIQSGVGTTLTGLSLIRTDSTLYVGTIDANNLVRTSPLINGQTVNHRIVRVENVGTPQVSIAPVDLNAGPSASPRPLANLLEMVVSADGSRVYVAAMGSDRVGVLDGATGRPLRTIETGRGPRGVALDDSAQRLYVFNRTDMMISSHDLSAGASAPALHKLYLYNPEPPSVKNGRHFVFSTANSRDGVSSCGTCHIDGNLDHLAWDLGDPSGQMLPAPQNVQLAFGNPTPNHPAKGPMVTQSLRGLARHNSFHWRGDKPQLEDFNEAFENLLGGEQLSDADIGAMADYIESLVYPPSPFFNRDNSFKDPAAAAGVVVWANNCQACHDAFHDGTRRDPEFTDDFGFDITSLDAQIQEVAQMRAIHRKFDSDLYTGFGTIHDGRERREANDHPLQTFLDDFFPFMPDNERSDLIAFITSFPTNVMSVVGWQVHLNGPVTVQQTADLDVMLSMAQPQATFGCGLPEGCPPEPYCDVVVHGVLGELSGSLWLADPVAGTFISDTSVMWTRDLLETIAAAGGMLVFQAVPAGSGRRLGIDWDHDCISNGVDAHPRGTPNLNGDNAVDLTDLSILLANFGVESVPREQGDADGDGDCDLTDLSILLSQFGVTCVY
ncbi:MAG: hypothetical protein ACKVS9_13135 [Phycisphaerae bacterium]